MFGCFRNSLKEYKTMSSLIWRLLTLDALMGWGTTSIPAEEVAVGKPGKWAWWLGGEAGKWAWLGGDAEEADSGRCVRP